MRDTKDQKDQRFHGGPVYPQFLSGSASNAQGPKVLKTSLGDQRQGVGANNKCWEICWQTKTWKKNTNKRTSKMMGILCKKQVETDTILQQRYEKDNRVNLPCVSTEPLNVTWMPTSVKYTHLKAADVLKRESPRESAVLMRPSSICIHIQLCITDHSKS